MDWSKTSWRRAMPLVVLSVAVAVAATDLTAHLVVGVRAYANWTLPQAISVAIAIAASAMLAATKIISKRERDLQTANAGLQTALETARSANREKEMLAQQLTQALDEHAVTQETLISALVGAVDARDPHTAGHSERVQHYALALAERLELPEGLVKLLGIGALLHDIGKIGIRDSLLMKPGRLTLEEIATIHHHTTMGADLLARVPCLEAAAAIAGAHHEMLDGSGYPSNLTAESIPLLTRIVTVCDIFDALTSGRPYHQPLAAVGAIEILRTQVRDGKLDRDVVKALDALLTESRLTLDDTVATSQPPLDGDAPLNKAA